MAHITQTRRASLVFSFDFLDVVVHASERFVDFFCRFYVVDGEQLGIIREEDAECSFLMQLY